MQAAMWEWPIQPPGERWAGMTTQEVLDGWRERIERLAFVGSEALAALPYVKAVAVVVGTRCFRVAARKLGGSARASNHSAGRGVGR